MSNEPQDLEKHLGILYNCHTHCFTIDHVPDRFAKGYFPPIRISWLRKYGILKWLVEHLPRIFGARRNVMLERLTNLVKYAELKDEHNNITQRAIIDKLRTYYPNDSKFVLLTMDMEYMDAEDPEKKFREQLTELADVKQILEDKILLFIFVDPRRISDKESDENPFTGQAFVKQVKEYISNKTYQGLKLYPPIGYYPFDIGLREVYEFAAKNNVPIITHCIRGPVHYRGENKWESHPLTHQSLPGTKAKEYANNLAHPLNYECLLNKDILKGLWKDENADLSNLKICLAILEAIANGMSLWRIPGYRAQKLMVVAQELILRGYGSGRKDLTGSRKVTN